MYSLYIKINRAIFCLELKPKLETVFFLMDLLPENWKEL